jgi:ABC-type oligopeptide transport system ATPase subunit
VLELKGLTRRYGDLVALDDLSFSVREGQMFGFVGPNGAGKTTAMRIVLGVLEADAGQVFWRGSPIDDQTRRRTGYVPEDHGQTFFNSAQALAPRGGSTRAKPRGNERNIGAPARGHPEGPVPDYTTVGWSRLESTAMRSRRGCHPSAPRARPGQAARWPWCSGR